MKSYYSYVFELFSLPKNHLTVFGPPVVTKKSSRCRFLNNDIRVRLTARPSRQLDFWLAEVAAGLGDRFPDT
jgi:hypothetical protein